MSDHITDIPLKRCSKCKNQYPATTEYFPSRSDSKDGLRGTCHECTHNRRVKYYQDHREQAIAYSAQWAADHPEQVKQNQSRWTQENIEWVRVQKKQWRKDHPEQTAEYNRRWKEANPDKVRERCRRWQRNNREQARASCRRYYWNHHEQRKKYRQQYNEAHKKQRAEQWRRWAKANPIKARENAHRRRARILAAEGCHTDDDILRQYNVQRGRCWWCNRKLNGVYHTDHLVPLARGGSDAPENLVISCPKCNLSRGAKLPHEWCGRLL